MCAAHVHRLGEEGDELLVGEVEEAELAPEQHLVGQAVDGGVGLRRADHVPVVDEAAQDAADAVVGQVAEGHPPVLGALQNVTFNSTTRQIVNVYVCAQHAYTVIMGLQEQEQLPACSPEKLFLHQHKNGNLFSQNKCAPLLKERRSDLNLLVIDKHSEFS